METIDREALRVSPLLHAHVSRFAQPGIEGIATEVASGANVSCPLGSLCSLTGRENCEACRSGRIGILARAAQRPTDGGARRGRSTNGFDASVAHLLISADSHNTRIELLLTNCQQRPIDGDFRLGKQDREPETGCCPRTRLERSRWRGGRFACVILPGD